MYLAIATRRWAYLNSKEEGNEAKRPEDIDGYHRGDDVIRRLSHLWEGQREGGR